MIVPVYDVHSKCIEISTLHSVSGLICRLALSYSTASGIEKLRFKPAYNPYTEPSMEVFSYHEGTYMCVQ